MKALGREFTLRTYEVRHVLGKAMNLPPADWG